MFGLLMNDNDSVHTLISQTVSDFVERQERDYFLVTNTMEGKKTICENGGKYLEENKVSEKQGRAAFFFR